MAQIDNGGNFSPDIFARLMALKNGSASEDELSQNEDQSTQAAQAGQNAAMGTMGGPQGSALKALATSGVEDTGLGMADKIRQAANSSAVKVLPSAADEEAAAFAKQAQGQPKFGEGYQSPGRNIPDQQMADYQSQLRDQAFQERLQQQKFQAIQNALKGAK